MGRLRPDEALATAHHRKSEGLEMWAKPESSRGAFRTYSIRLGAKASWDACVPMRPWRQPIIESPKDLRCGRSRNRVGGAFRTYSIRLGAKASWDACVPMRPNTFKKLKGSIFHNYGYKD